MVRLILIDHHCPWIGNCVGGKNIIKFYKFLICTNIHSIIVFVSSLITFLRQIDIYNTLDKDKRSFNEYMIISLCLIIYSGLVMLLMFGAIFHQSWLITNNITTNECLRQKLPDDTFDNGCSENWNEVC